jgi:hypothetical protein
VRCVPNRQKSDERQRQNQFFYQSIHAVTDILQHRAKVFNILAGVLPWA